jgi:Transcriptional regulators
MNIYSKINHISFTESEKIFLDYVIDNYQKVNQLSVKDLSKACYVSVSTIYRVLEKLELSSIHQLKLLLVSDRKEYDQEKELVDYNYPFDKNATHYEIMRQMSKLYQQTVSSTLNLINLETFLKVIQLLRNSQNIVLYPTVGNYFFAESFQQSMLEIGIKVEVQTNIFYQHWSAQNCKKGDCVIVISYNNRTPHLFDVTKEAKERGAKIVLISSTKESALTSLVDYHLYFSSYEDSKDKITSFSSRVSLQYLLDCIYACYFNSDYEKHLRHKIDHYVEY